MSKPKHLPYKYTQTLTLQVNQKLTLQVYTDTNPTSKPKH